MKEDKLGRLLRLMVPPVDATGVWESIEQTAGCEPTNPASPVPASDAPQFAGNAKPARLRRIPKTIRLIGLTAVAVIVLVAVGFGINALIEQLGQGKSVVVITDGSMSPGATGPAGGEVSSVEESPLKYGEILRFGALEMAITVAPQSVPLVTPSEPDPPVWAGKRVRSQLIMTNRGYGTYNLIAADIQLVDAAGGRYFPVGTESRQAMVVGPGATVTMGLDWVLAADVAVANVIYAPTFVPTGGSGKPFRWGPEAITAGPGYPVLTSLPPLRAEDVESLEYEGWDEQGRPLPTQSVTAAENSAGIAALIELYGQTTLDPAEGYPNYTTPVHLTLHLKDGTDFSIWIQGPDSDVCIIQDTRSTTEGNPPAASGINPALVRAFYGLDGAYGEAGWTLNPFAGVSGTTTTFGHAQTTDSRPASSTPSTDTPQGPTLSWGETAALEGRTVTVSEPVDDPQAVAPWPGSRMVYSIVTIVNTGSTTLTYRASEFFLEGNGSGSSGLPPRGGGASDATVGGQPMLEAGGGTLAPGESVTGAVHFQLKAEDVPVKLRLVSPTSTNVVYASWK